MAGFVGALIAVAWMLALPVTPAVAPGRHPTRVEAAWPQAVRGEAPAASPDGSAYTPEYFLDARSSIGTALTRDGAYLRLLSYLPNGTINELRRLPVAAMPRFRGFAGGDGWLAWAESAQDEHGRRIVKIWALRVGSDEPARMVTAQTGVVSFTDSQFDLIIANGRVHWASAGQRSRRTTEVRSVPLTGGDVHVESHDGAWTLAAWPWLVGVPSLIGGPIRLLDLEKGRTAVYVPAAAELPVCGATWCRSVVLSGSGAAGLDLVRVDGSQRRRMPTAEAASPLADVALRDRFEVMTSFARRYTSGSGRPLSVYDIATGATVSLADDAVTVASRGNFLWWSSGSPRASAWHTIDLGTVP